MVCYMTATLPLRSDMLLNFFYELHRVNKKSWTAKSLAIGVHFNEVLVIWVVLASVEELVAYSTARGMHPQTKDSSPTT